jgi:hypothetical protein
MPHQIHDAMRNYSLTFREQYFAKPHLKVTEDEKAVGVVMRLEEEVPVRRNTVRVGQDEDIEGDNEDGGRRMFVTAVGSRLSVVKDQRTDWPLPASPGNFRLSFIPGAADHIPPGPTKAQQALGRQPDIHAIDFDTVSELRNSQRRHGIAHSASRTGRDRRTSWARSPV